MICDECRCSRLFVSLSLTIISQGCHVGRRVWYKHYALQWLIFVGVPQQGPKVLVLPSFEGGVRELQGYYLAAACAHTLEAREEKAPEHNEEEGAGDAIVAPAVLIGRQRAEQAQHDHGYIGQHDPAGRRCGQEF